VWYGRQDGTREAGKERIFMCASGDGRSSPDAWYWVLQQESCFGRWSCRSQGRAGHVREMYRRVFTFTPTISRARSHDPSSFSLGSSRLIYRFYFDEQHFAEISRTRLFVAETEYATVMMIRTRTAFMISAVLTPRAYQDLRSWRCPST
jgi:hypothetical protein